MVSVITTWWAEIKNVFGGNLRVLEITKPCQRIDLLNVNNAIGNHTLVDMDADNLADDYVLSATVPGVW